MMKQYLWNRWHFIFPKEHSWRRKLRTWLSGEALMWLIVTLVSLQDLAMCTGFNLLFELPTSPSRDLELLPMYTIFNAVSLVAFLLLRILQAHTVEICAHVHYHKIKAKRKLEEVPTDENKALIFLEKLQLNFPDCYPRKLPPRDIHDVMMTWDSRETSLKKMVWCSTCVLFASLIWMHLTVLQDQSLELDFSNAKWRLNLLAAVLKSYGASLSWFVLVVGILSTTLTMRENARQLLLFASLTSYSNIDEWSKKHREELGSVLENALGNERSSTASSLHLEEPMSERRLQRALDKRIGRERLDLMDLEDIKAWRDLRGYIQIDFLDESAMVDFCGVLTLLLLLCFACSGCFDWIANADPFSPGLILVAILSICLGVIMLNVIQACIDINELLDRDAEVLTEASAEALLLRRENAAEVAALLHSIERRIAMFDDKQQILGFTMTASFRNGWVASLVLAALSSLVELVRTMRKDVGYWIATGDQLIMNATMNAWSFWSHNETSQ